jgi:predicted PurR-regulated permease PerM
MTLFHKIFLRFNHEVKIMFEYLFNDFERRVQRNDNYFFKMLASFIDELVNSLVDLFLKCLIYLFNSPFLKGYFVRKGNRFIDT